MASPEAEIVESFEHPHLKSSMSYNRAVAEYETDPVKKMEAQLSYRVGGILSTLSPDVFTIGVKNGYFQAKRKKDEDEIETPKAGLKIHVSIKPEDPFYLDTISIVTAACAGESPSGLPTTFKIMTPSFQRSNEQEDDDYSKNQSLKCITIYPRYRVKDDSNVESTNVPEMIRIIEELRLKLSDHKEELSERRIVGELEVAPGIFIRPGPFTSSVAWLASSDASLGFEGQLAALRVNQDDFRRELENSGIYKK